MSDSLLEAIIFPIHVYLLDIIITIRRSNYILKMNLIVLQRETADIFLISTLYLNSKFDISIRCGLRLNETI